MLKFENIASVGQTIRAYDFKPMVGREDTFVEGVVERITTEAGYKAFKITVTKDSWDEGRKGKIVFVPMEVSFMEYDARIINLSI